MSLSLGLGMYLRGSPAAQPVTPLAFSSVGTVTNGASSPAAIAYPAGIAAGDALLLVVNCTATAPAGVTTPSGWTLIASASNTATTRFVAVYRLTSGAATGSESGSVSVTLTGTSPSGHGYMVRVTKDAAKTVSYAGAGGEDTTLGPDFSVTAGSDPGITVDDYVCAAAVTDNTLCTFSAEALSASGVTFGTVTERVDANGRAFWDALATAGTSSAAPVASATISTTVVGPAVIVRLRQA